MLTRLSAYFIDKTLKPGEEGDNVFSFLAAAVNKILFAVRKDGFASKYEVAELATRMWLVWSSYEKDNNPAFLDEMKSIGEQLMKLAGS